MTKLQRAINNDRTIAVHGKHTETIDKDTTMRRITSARSSNP